MLCCWERVGPIRGCFAALMVLCLGRCFAAHVVEVELPSTRAWSSWRSSSPVVLRAVWPSVTQRNTRCCAAFMAFSAEALPPRCFRRMLRRRGRCHFRQMLCCQGCCGCLDGCFAVGSSSGCFAAVIMYGSITAGYQCVGIICIRLSCWVVRWRVPHPHVLAFHLF
jgi:hypothetical protein